MKLHGENFKVVLDDLTGTPLELTSSNDPYEMNWIRGDYPWGTVTGFDIQCIRKTGNGICAFGVNEEKKLSLTVKRYVENGKYKESYTFANMPEYEDALLDDSVGMVFSYNDLFDNKENMLHTRCNSHVWCADNVCNIHSVKLDGQKPYLIQKAVGGSFSGYGLLCDICPTPNASHDRGNIVLYPQYTAIKRGESVSFLFEFYFSDSREPISCISADRYSGFVGDQFTIVVQWNKKIEELFAECDGAPISFNINGNTASARIEFNSVGDKTVNCSINGTKTFIRFNVLDSIENILEQRVRFIVEKQQYDGDDPHLAGAYMIYDREIDSQYYSRSFSDHNCARERLSMGTLVAASLARKYNSKVKASLDKHREFIEREILDINTGCVKNGIDDPSKRLYNYPWVSTYYLEWYRFSKDAKCLSIAAKVLLKYYELGGTELEAPCNEAFAILEHLKQEGFNREYSLLRESFLSHCNSIHRRRTASTSPEVACANGMMNLMSTILLQGYLLTADSKYLESIQDLLKVAESFYDFQPDPKMYGIALRYWDMFWFGKKKSYGDTYPQWISVLTAQMYNYCDLALGTDHSDLIRENLLGNCGVYFPDGFASCGYLYPKKVTVFSSLPEYKNSYRPIGVWNGKRFDEFANDQDWSLYYTIKYLNL